MDVDDPSAAVSLLRESSAALNDLSRDERRTMSEEEELRGLNGNLRPFMSPPSVSGTLKHQMVLQKLTLNRWPAERRPLTRRRAPNMIAFVLWRIFKWGFIKAWSVGHNTTILPNWYRCCTSAGSQLRG